MKSIKSRMIYFTGLCTLGIIFILISLVFKFENSSIFTIGAAFVVSGGLRLYRFNKILKDDEKREEYNIKQNEERLVYLALKSANLSFRITLIVEFAAVIILMIIGENYTANTVCAVACSSLILYIVIYFIYCKKY